MYCRDKTSVQDSSIGHSDEKDVCSCNVFFLCFCRIRIHYSLEHKRLKFSVSNKTLNIPTVSHLVSWKIYGSPNIWNEYKVSGVPLWLMWDEVESLEEKDEPDVAGEREGGAGSADVSGNKWRGVCAIHNDHLTTFRLCACILCLTRFLGQLVIFFKMFSKLQKRSRT